MYRSRESRGTQLARPAYRSLGQLDQAYKARTGALAPEVIAEDFFIYTTRFQNLNASTTGNQFIQIEADSDFLIQKLAASTFEDDSALTVFTQPLPLVTILIVDTGSGRQIMNEPIPVGAFFGDGRLPYILPTPKLFVKNSRIQVTLFNFTAGVNYENIWINFEGKKIFTAG